MATASDHKSVGEMATASDHKSVSEMATASDHKSVGEMATASDHKYYDIVLFGRTGQGKSTLGNKLLQHKTKPKSLMKITHALTNTRRMQGQEIPVLKETSINFSHFFTSNDVTTPGASMLSVTNIPEVALNPESQVRVLDMPGFADTAVFSKTGATIFEDNLKLFRAIQHQQQWLTNKWHFSRVLYFLPVRGIVEKVDATLQEELKVMFHFYGFDIFKCMVIIATTQKRRHRPQERLYKEDIEDIKEAFLLAFHMATANDAIGAKNQLTKCPPVVFIGIDDEDVLEAIQKAEVLVKDFKFVPKFDNTCINCAAKILYHQNPAGDIEPYLIQRNGEQKKYEESYCHPYFIQRSTQVERIFGTFAHFATLGIPYIYGKYSGHDTWAGVYSSDEICVNCHRFLGCKECCYKVKTKFLGEEVEHRTTLAEQ